jgi:hypothetical protein
MANNRVNKLVIGTIGSTGKIDTFIVKDFKIKLAPINSVIRKSDDVVQVYSGNYVDTVALDFHECEVSNISIEEFKIELAPAYFFYERIGDTVKMTYSRSK